jgi:hypothetical protein
MCLQVGQQALSFHWILLHVVVQVLLSSTAPDTDVDVHLPTGTYSLDPKLPKHVECAQKLASVLQLHGAGCFKLVAVDGVRHSLSNAALSQLFTSFSNSQAENLKVSAPIAKHICCLLSNTSVFL